MRSILRAAGFLLLFALLTVLTQIGGLALLLSTLLSRRLPGRFRFKSLATFTGTYLLLTFLIVPLLAPAFGRERVNHGPGITPTNWMTVVLNRNYVRPALNDVLRQAAEDLRPRGIRINYLDANFPFVNGFPLLPHLSHNDGKKIDLSLVYEDGAGNISKRQTSFSGYGVFAGPRAGETDQTAACLRRGKWQYDLTKYARFARVNKDLQFSAGGTKALVRAVLRSQQVGKILIEPHLERRLGLTEDRVRFHGCHAVRHDDHIHVQL